MVEASGGVLSQLFAYVFKVFGFILGKWKVSVPLIVVVTAVLSSTGAAIQEKSFVPVVSEIGGTLFSTNHQINREATRIINDGGIKVQDVEISGASAWQRNVVTPLRRFWATIASLWNLGWALILFFWWFVFLLWAAGYITNNDSAKFGVFSVAILIYFVITSLYGAYFIYPDLEKNTGIKTPLTEKLNPFSGIFKLAEAVPFFKPIYSSFETDIGSNATISSIKMGA